MSLVISIPPKHNVFNILINLNKNYKMFSLCDMANICKEYKVKGNHCNLPH